MLTKEKCLQALLELSVYAEYNTNEVERKELAKESNLLRQLINEHFDNPPLKFEELHDKMWVWDNKYKQYIKIRRVKKKNSFIGYYPNFECDPITDEPYENLQGVFFFEENRFYRYEVKEDD